MTVERWNGGRTRRYHIGRAVLTVSRSAGRRFVRAVPRDGRAAIDICPTEAARQLCALRSEHR